MSQLPPSVMPIWFSQTKSEKKYVFNSAYSWFLVVCILLMVVSVSYEINHLTIILYVIFLTYFALKILLSRKYSKEISIAVRNETADISGSRFSFSNPLTIKVISSDPAEDVAAHEITEKERLDEE